MGTNQRPKGHWNSFSNLERALGEYMNGHGAFGVMPKKEQLARAGLSNVAKAIGAHGGFQSVAERLGLKLGYVKRKSKYWDDLPNVENEILLFTRKHGSPGVMPTQAVLRKLGMNALAGAIQKHGGFSAVAEQLNLELGYSAKPKRFWNDFSSVEREILKFISEHGIAGVMPTQKQLLEAGRSDLTKPSRNMAGIRRSPLY